jgi:hypothetical protein
MQAQRSSAFTTARTNGMFDVSHAGEYCLAPTSDASAAVALADGAEKFQLVTDMEDLLQVTGRLR